MTFSLLISSDWTVDVESPELGLPFVILYFCRLIFFYMSRKVYVNPIEN